MMGRQGTSRRGFIRAAGAAGGSLLLAGRVATVGASAEEAGTSSMAHGAEGISPAEDLMREHGVLRRILLLYGEGVRRIEFGEDLPAGPLADAAGIVRTFIEGYHEELEEDFLFPRFRKASKLADLTDVLLEQHRAGRRLTDTTLKLAGSAPAQNADDRRALADALSGFIRMYSPHAAREDTVLFPAIRDVVSPEEYADLGEKFEDKEQELFGEGGFGKTVEHVAAIERTLGMYDLRQFTPRG